MFSNPLSLTTLSKVDLKRVFKLRFIMVIVQNPKFRIKSLSRDYLLLLYLIRSTNALSRAFNASSTTSLLKRLGLVRDSPCVGNRDWVAKYSTKSFLENRVLTLRLGNLFFPGVVVEVVLEGGVYHEARTDVVNVLSFHALIFYFLGGVDVLSRNAREFSRNVKAECSESFYVHALKIMECSTWLLLNFSPI